MNLGRKLFVATLVALAVLLATAPGANALLGNCEISLGGVTCW